MMRQRLMTYLLILLLIPVLFSCEGETRYTKIIENQTDYDIALIIHHHTSSLFPNDTIIIAAGESYTLAYDEMLGEQSDIMNPMEGADSVDYIVPSGIYMDKDIMNPDSWIASVKQVSNLVWEHTYTFKLKPEHIWVVTKLNEK